MLPRDIKLEAPARAVATHIEGAIDAIEASGGIEKFLKSSHQNEPVPGLDGITYGELRECYKNACIREGAHDPIALYQAIEKLIPSKESASDCPVDTGDYVPREPVLTKERLEECVAAEISAQLRTAVSVERELKVPEALARSIVKSQPQHKYVVAGLSAVAAGSTFVVAQHLANQPKNRVADAVCAGIAVLTYPAMNEKISSVPNSATMSEGFGKVAASALVVTGSIAAQVAVRKGLGYFSSAAPAVVPAPVSAPANDDQSLAHFYS